MILLFPPPILDSFLDHGRGNHKEQRQKRADGRVGRELGQRKGTRDKEVEIGDPPELLKEGLGQEGDQRVLCGGHLVARVPEALCFMPVGIVDVNDAGEARRPDLGLVLGGALGAEREAVQCAQLQLLQRPPSPCHFFGGEESGYRWELIKAAKLGFLGYSRGTELSGGQAY